MYKIYFYEDRAGNSPVFEYIQALAQKTDKDSRINSNKIDDYIQALSEYGKTLGEPYIKHIDEDIWELRPIRNRIFFAVWNVNGFILLHHFIKKSQKTPKREIEQAKRNLKCIRERSENNEKME